MSEQNQAARDLRVLEIYEISLRGLAAPHEAASEVVSRLAASRRFQGTARPVRYAMGQCLPSVLITSVAALRSRLEEE